jgi:hypothetical protein
MAGMASVDVRTIVVIAGTFDGAAFDAAAFDVGTEVVTLPQPVPRIRVWDDYGMRKKRRC